MAKKSDDDERLRKGALVERQRRQRAARIVAMGKEHQLTNEQLAALRDCNTSLGPKVWQRDTIRELIQMGLVEQKLGGPKVTTKGKATLMVNKRSI